MSLDIGKDVTIEDGKRVAIRAKSGFIGDRTIIRSGAVIEGTHVEIGTESYIDRFAVIGGGSCNDSGAYLKAGCWFHMGWNSQVNTARGVYIGDEVGLGIETKIFTHGAYLPIDYGFPAQWGTVYIGNRVWIPNAWVNPGVAISDDIVIAARSLVAHSLEVPGMYAGCPAVIVKPYGSVSLPFYALLILGRIEDSILRDMASRYYFSDEQIFDVKGTRFDLVQRTITGHVTEKTEELKNQLRRNGIRFKFYAKNGEYVPWDE